MNQPPPVVHQALDRLVLSTVSFALYRLPQGKDPVLELQSNGLPRTYSQLDDLNNQAGFLLAPFRPTPHCPIVLIGPDQQASGWPAIGHLLHHLPVQDQIGQPSVPPIIPEEQEYMGYRQAFGRFMEPLQRQIYQKLVLSRRSIRELPGGFSPVAAFIRACQDYPDMMVSLCHSPLTGTWLGSTPEMLLTSNGCQGTTMALAGTMPRCEASPTWTSKNLREQGIVSQYIREQLREISPVVTEHGPVTAPAGQLVHLKTEFRFTLSDENHLGSLLRSLHPTPAVCGYPQAEASRFITDSEGFDRRYYAGIIGKLAPGERTTLFVNLRCMEMSAGTAILYVGSGLLATSELQDEWEETQQKLHTILDILRPGSDVATETFTSC